MFFKKNPDRDVYKSKIWRFIPEIDRAHIILVAEHAKPGAICNKISSEEIKDYISANLNIRIIDSGKNIQFARSSKRMVWIPVNPVFICNSRKTLKQYIAMSSISNYVSSWEHQGKLFGYPNCCIREYCNPTFKEKYNPLILKFLGKNTCTFEIEIIRGFLEGKDFSKDFLYLMPSQTPHSVNCRRTKALMRKWGRLLRKYDKEAAEMIEKFNLQDFARMKTIAQDFEKKGITSEMFDKSYIWRR